jgi:hypothetical protein
VLAELFKEACLKTATVQIAMSSFRAAGIWPQSPNNYTVTLDVLNKPVTWFAGT